MSRVTNRTLDVGTVQGGASRSTAISAQLSDAMMEVLLAWLRTALLELRPPELASGAIVESVRTLLDVARQVSEPAQIELEVFPGTAHGGVFFRAWPVRGPVASIRDVGWEHLTLAWQRVRVAIREEGVEILLDEIPVSVTRPRW